MDPITSIQLDIQVRQSQPIEVDFLYGKSS